VFQRLNNPFDAFPALAFCYVHAIFREINKNTINALRACKPVGLKMLYLPLNTTKVSGKDIALYICDGVGFTAAFPEAIVARRCGCPRVTGYE